MIEVTDVSAHPALLAAITNDIPNTVKLLTSPHPIHRYTCLVHVFDFTEKPAYIEIARWGFNIGYASPDFAHWLIDHGFLKELSLEAVQEGDMVFYFDPQGRLKHAGLMISKDRVLSKWGTGHLFEHQLNEVPESYGNTKRFYSRMECDGALAHFKEYVRGRGMLI